MQIQPGRLTWWVPFAEMSCLKFFPLCGYLAKTSIKYLTVNWSYITQKCGKNGNLTRVRELSCQESVWILYNFLECNAVYCDTGYRLSSETSVSFHQTSRRHILGDSLLQYSLRARIIKFMLHSSEYLWEGKKTVVQCSIVCIQACLNLILTVNIYTYGV